MAVRKILRMGHPLLRRVAREVTEFDSVELDQLLGDMFDTMRAAQGVGLAAPQIGVSHRVVIFGLEQNERYPEAEAVPWTILINPVIEPVGEATQQGWEGCLSVPGMRGLVRRHSCIRYRGYDETGRPIEREANGFHAVVVQHECDHLDGILYPQRITDMRNFGFEEEMLEWQAQGNPQQPS